MHNMKTIPLLVVAAVFSCAISAQPRVGGPLACTPATISGPYGYAFSGFSVVSARLLPFAEQGTLVADGNGSLSGVATESLGGAFATANFSGTYTINAACSGTATLNAGGNVANVAFTIVNNGGQLNFIQTDTGTLISGTSVWRLDAIPRRSAVPTLTPLTDGYLFRGAINHLPIREESLLMAMGISTARALIALPEQSLGGLFLATTQWAAIARAPPA